MGAVTAKFYKSPVSSQDPPSREASKEKSPERVEVETVGRELGQVNIQREANKVEAKKEDWDIKEGDGWGDIEEKSENKISEGWDDDEDWGSLEDTKPEPKQSPPVNEDWEGGLNKGVKTHGAFSDIKPSKANDSSDWDDWGGNSSTKTEDNKDEARKRREEKRLERQKEIEAKRSAKKGPMKLGGKKMID